MHQLTSLKAQLELIASAWPDYINKDFNNDAEEMEYLRVQLSSVSMVAVKTVEMMRYNPTESE